MTVNNLVVPTISIAVSPDTSVCKGSKVTFTATVTNGGASPPFQWKKNGINVGTNSKTYIVDTALKNGDSIYCILTSTSKAACLTPTTAKSNVIKMTVNNPATPTVTIAASPGTDVCKGRKVTFTATPTNGGTAPVYQWKKNGASIGANNKTYVDSTLKTGDSIYCVLASNASCITTSIVNSNGIKMTVNNPATPTVTIAASSGTSVCKGTKVTFTANVTNGGTSPIYQWKRNGISIGTNSKTYVDSTLKTGDSIYCVLASNASCITTSIVNSNGMKMTVSDPVTPTVSIAVSPGTTVCAGSKVTFTATVTNAGASPPYQWKKNGINVGTNSRTYIVDTGT
jgi:predicted deacylase